MKGNEYCIIIEYHVISVPFFNKQEENVRWEAMALTDEELRKLKRGDLLELLVAQAEAETREFWDMVSRRLENFYNEHAGLRELLALDQLKSPAPAPAEEAPVEEGPHE